MPSKNDKMFTRFCPNMVSGHATLINSPKQKLCTLPILKYGAAVLQANTNGLRMSQSALMVYISTPVHPSFGSNSGPLVSSVVWFMASPKRTIVISE